MRAEQPNHPGVAHYLIHANNSAEMAEDGLTAALCYADIAPAVPHALHMPSHIFTRLGMWRQSIDANRAATAAGLAYVREELGPDAFNGEAVHSMDYMEYAYLQMGQDREAKRVVDELLTFRRANVPNLPMAYAIAAMPARYAVERRNWPEAAALTAPPMAFPWERFPWAEAMISFTRALGAAHTGDIAGAETEIAKLQSLKEKLDQAKDDYWAKQVEVQRLAASGILAHAQGDDKKAVELVRAAADLDATMDKHPATPAEVLPARELLADLLLELNDPAAALKEYEQTVSAERNRFRSILGIARAAKQTGDTAKAREAYGSSSPWRAPTPTARNWPKPRPSWRIDRYAARPSPARCARTPPRCGRGASQTLLPLGHRGRRGIVVFRRTSAASELPAFDRGFGGATAACGAARRIGSKPRRRPRSRSRRRYIPWGHGTRRRRRSRSCRSTSGSSRPAS